MAKGVKIERYNVMETIKYFDGKQISAINLFTIATPFKGTILATPTQLKDKIKKKIPVIGGWAYKKYYEKTYTYTPVDNDIGIGTEFIDSLEDTQPLLEKVTFTNITTSCNGATFKKTLKELVTGRGKEKAVKPIQSLLLHLLNSLVVNGDGVVELESQRAFSKFANQTIHLNTTHAEILNNPNIGQRIGKIISEITLQRESKLRLRKTPEMKPLVAAKESEKQIKVLELTHTEE